ncbi:hypothetical protein DFH11DRAFT_511312 [Phellopilus nigrolimitatus]|nr:hypothetical protein DFH11DRAFT_511312 [Phellopilus nigrolimitatus]
MRSPYYENLNLKLHIVRARIANARECWLCFLAQTIRSVRLSAARARPNQRRPCSSCEHWHVALADLLVTGASIFLILTRANDVIDTAARCLVLPVRKTFCEYNKTCDIVCERNNGWLRRSEPRGGSTALSVSIIGLWKSLTISDIHELFSKSTNETWFDFTLSVHQGRGNPALCS